MNLLRNGQVSHNSAVAGESVGQWQGTEAGRQEPEPWASLSSKQQSPSEPALVKQKTTAIGLKTTQV